MLSLNYNGMTGMPRLT